MQRPVGGVTRAPDNLQLARLGVLPGHPEAIPIQAFNDSLGVVLLLHAVSQFRLRTSDSVLH